MRKLSETIKKVLEQDWKEMADLVDITIPEYSYFDTNQNLVTLPAIVLNLAASSGIVIDGVPYQDSLRSVGQIKYSIGTAPDNASITVENVSRGFGNILTSQRKLDGSRCTIKRAFKTELGWETDIIFPDGYLRDIKIDAETINLSLVHEMSRKGFNVAGRSATQRCWWIFRGYGCEWTQDQPGDPNFCDRGEDTPNGCLSHGNITQFGAVPPFALLEGGNGYEGNSEFPHHGGMGWCVHPNTNIYCVDDSGRMFFRKVRDLKKGDVVLSVDLFGNVFRTNVHDNDKGKTSRIITIHTENYSLTCSPSHPIIRFFGDSNGIAASELKRGDLVLTYTVGDVLAKQEEILAIEVIDTEQEIYMLKLDPSHTFISSNQKKGGIVSHNNKPILQSGEVYSYNLIN